MARMGNDAQAHADRAQERLDEVARYSCSPMERRQAYALEGIGYALLAIREQLAAGVQGAEENTTHLAERLDLMFAPENRRPRRGWLPRGWRR